MYLDDAFIQSASILTVCVFTWESKLVVPNEMLY